MIWWLSFEKKAISILAGNLNSSRSYLITAVLRLMNILEKMDLLVTSCLVIRLINFVNAHLKKGQTKHTVKNLIKIPRLTNILEKMDLLVTSCLVFKSLVAATSSEATNWDRHKNSATIFIFILMTDGVVLYE